jgi:hypothetical protein
MQRRDAFHELKEAVYLPFVVADALRAIPRDMRHARSDGSVAQPAAALRASPLAKNDPISDAHRGLAKR